MPALNVQDRSYLELYPIKKMKYFGDSSPEELAQLEAIRKYLVIDDNRNMALSKDEQEGFFYIHEGFCKLLHRSETLRLAGPGDIIGYGRWMSHLSDYHFVTMSEMKASFFPRAEFTEIQKRSFYLSNEISRWLLETLFAQEEQICIMRKTSARNRVAASLSVLTRRFGKRIGGRTCEGVTPIDRKTLAEISGVVTEVLSRVLNDLEEKHFISREGRAIVVTDDKGLASAANNPE